MQSWFTGERRSLTVGKTVVRCQNPFSVNSATNAITIWPGTPPASVPAPPGPRRCRYAPARLNSFLPLPADLAAASRTPQTLPFDPSPPLGRMSGETCTPRDRTRANCAHVFHADDCVIPSSCTCSVSECWINHLALRLLKTVMVAREIREKSSMSLACPLFSQ